jgi:hypothetical protein
MWAKLKAQFSRLVIFFRPDSAERGMDFYSAFPKLWILATIFHNATFGDWMLSPLGTAVSLLAFFLLLNPIKMPGFLMFVLLQASLIIWQLPNVLNHSIFVLFVDITILISVAFALGRGQFDRIKSFNFIGEFAPAVRVQLLILYFCAVLHKLNTGYLQTEYSCAVMIHDIRAIVFFSMLIGLRFFPQYTP